MSNIGTEKNSGSGRDERNLLWDDERVHTTEFQVHLQADIGAVLLLGIMNVLGLDTLCGNSNDGIGNALDFSIERNSCVGQDTDDELRSSLSSITSLKPSFLQGTVNVSLGISVGNRGCLVDNILLREGKGAC
jgi:hypothetical protein